MSINQRSFKKGHSLSIDLSIFKIFSWICVVSKKEDTFMSISFKYVCNISEVKDMFFIGCIYFSGDIIFSSNCSVYNGAPKLRKDLHTLVIVCSHMLISRQRKMWLELSTIFKPFLNSKVSASLTPYNFIVFRVIFFLIIILLNLAVRQCVFLFPFFVFFKFFFNACFTAPYRKKYFLGSMI